MVMSFIFKKFRRVQKILKHFSLKSFADFLKNFRSSRNNIVWDLFYFPIIRYHPKTGNAHGERQSVPWHTSRKSAFLSGKVLSPQGFICRFTVGEWFDRVSFGRCPPPTPVLRRRPRSGMRSIVSGDAVIPENAAVIRLVWLFFTPVRHPRYLAAFGWPN